MDQSLHRVGQGGVSVRMELEETTNVMIFDLFEGKRERIGSVLGFIVMERRGFVVEFVEIDYMGSWSPPRRDEREVWFVLK